MRKGDADYCVEYDHACLRAWETDSGEEVICECGCHDCDRCGGTGYITIPGRRCDTQAKCLACRIPGRAS